MITWTTKKEGLWFILEVDPNKGKGVAPSYLDEKKEYLLYIMTKLIKSGLLGKLIDLDDPKQLLNFFKTNFKISNNSHKFHLWNKFDLILMIKENTFQSYFFEFMSVLAQLLELGVKVLDVDLVQIMMKVVADIYNFSCNNTLAKLSFLASNTYKLPLCLKRVDDKLERESKSY